MSYQPLGHQNTSQQNEEDYSSLPMSSPKLIDLPSDLQDVNLDDPSTPNTAKSMDSI